MITLQHALTTYLDLRTSNSQNIKFEEELPYVLLPDAIRMYTGPRQYSHFEMTEDEKDVSWMSYPKGMPKNLSKELIEQQPRYLSDKIRPSCMGETTNIQAFEEHNQHLNVLQYSGIKRHLIQDSEFDIFIRSFIDDSQKYDDNFKFNGEALDGKEVRALIAKIEQEGLYVLSKKIYEQYGITTNQEWFDNNVKNILKDTYHQEMFENTYRYMQIDEHINKLITNHNWSQMNNLIIPEEEWLKCYENIIDRTDRDLGLLKADVLLENGIKDELNPEGFGEMILNYADNHRELLVTIQKDELALEENMLTL